MKKSVITDDFEQKPMLPPATVSKRSQKLLSKKEREKTKGDSWFHLPATEVTDERKTDLELLKMRDALDPKRHYKGNDKKVLPKYFEVGTIKEDATDFYHARVPMKQRKRTLVEELMADVDAQRYNKKKYGEIMAERARSKKGSFRHVVAAKKRKTNKHERNKVIRDG